MLTGGYYSGKYSGQRLFFIPDIIAINLSRGFVELDKKGIARKIEVISLSMGETEPLFNYHGQKTVPDELIRQISSERIPREERERYIRKLSKLLED